VLDVVLWSHGPSQLAESVGWQCLTLFCGLTVQVSWLSLWVGSA